MLNIQAGTVYDTVISGTVCYNDLSGTIYTIREQGSTWKDPSMSVIRWDNGKYSYNYEYDTFVQLDPIVIAQLDCADLNHKNLIDSFQKAAHERANGDEVLEAIIAVAMEYRNSTEVQPSIKDGIEFFGVGHNASHAFYLGRKDGETYKRSYYCDYDPETGECFEEDHIRKLAPGEREGYIGHY